MALIDDVFVELYDLNISVLGSIVFLYWWYASGVESLSEVFIFLRDAAITQHVYDAAKADGRVENKL